MPPCIQTARSIAEAKPLPIDLVAKAKQQLSSALFHIHAKGWSFCDIKPDNIFVSINGRSLNCAVLRFVCM
jgi:serine/threonine protein kinase